MWLGFQIAQIPPLPEHALKAVFAFGIEAFNAYWDDGSKVSTIPGTGPFTLSRYLADSSFVMKPNPRYFETDSEGVSLPYVDEYTVFFAADAEAQIEMLYSGRIDHCVLPNADIAATVEMKEKIGVELYNAGPAMQTHFLAYNQNPEAVTADSGIEEHELSWLNNRKFRVALSGLVNREAIIEEVGSGFGYPQVSFVPYGSPYYWHGAEAAVRRSILPRPGGFWRKPGFVTVTVTEYVKTLTATVLNWSFVRMMTTKRE